MPRQERARFTVDAILEATAHILTEDGMAAATTNHIAERAGVSIGSLYQYFPNRNALVGALVQRYLDDRVTLIDGVFAALGAMPVEQGLPCLVDAIFDANREHTRLNRVLVEQLGMLYGLDPVRRIEDHLAERLQEYFERQAGGLALDDLQAAAFVLARVGRTLAQAALQEHPHIDERRIRSELVRLGLRYLFGDAGPSPADGQAPR